MPQSLFAAIWPAVAEIMSSVAKWTRGRNDWRLTAKLKVKILPVQRPYAHVTLQNTSTFITHLHYTAACQADLVVTSCLATSSPEPEHSPLSDPVQHTFSQSLIQYDTQPSHLALSPDPFSLPHGCSLSATLWKASYFKATKSLFSLN